MCKTWCKTSKRYDRFCYEETFYKVSEQKAL